MKKIFILLACACSISLFSCTKEGDGYGDKHYYGAVTFEVAPLPNTPDIKIVLNGQEIGNWRGARFTVAAKSPNQISFYNAGTNELIADTVVTLAPDESSNFRIAYSEALGIKGFLQGGGAPVSADSIRIQFANTLSDTYSPAAGVDLYLLKADFYTLEITDTVTVIRDFKKGQVMPPVTLKAEDVNNPTYYLVGLLRNRQTGTFIYDQQFGWFPVIVDWWYYTGKYEIAVVNDNGGVISAALIDL